MWDEKLIINAMLNRLIQNYFICQCFLMGDWISSNLSAQLLLLPVSYDLCLKTVWLFRIINHSCITFLHTVDVEVRSWWDGNCWHMQSKDTVIVTKWTPWMWSAPCWTTANISKSFFFFFFFLPECCGFKTNFMYPATYCTGLCTYTSVLRTEHGY